MLYIKHHFNQYICNHDDDDDDDDDDDKITPRSHWKYITTNVIKTFQDP